MADFYARMAATVVRLLAAYGQPVTIVRVGGTPDPVEGELIKEAETSLTTTGVVLDTSVKWVRETLVPGADVAIVLDATVAPLLEDAIEIAGVRFTPIDLRTVQPAAIPLAYVIHAKR